MGVKFRPLYFLVYDSERQLVQKNESKHAGGDRSEEDGGKHATVIVITYPLPGKLPHKEADNT